MLHQILRRYIIMIISVPLFLIVRAVLNCNGRRKWRNGLPPQTRRHHKARRTTAPVPPALYHHDYPPPLPHRPSSTDPSEVLPEDLLREVLTRLPVKSLMRFKCVSKYWQSIIVDPSFALDYRGGFRGLLDCEPIFPRRLETKRRFFYLSLDGSTSQVSYHSALDHDGKRMGITDVVNGLVCFYYRNHSWLYNVATHETMQLPVSTYEAQVSFYNLGFDPVNKLYKLVKMCPVYDNYNDDNPEDDEALDNAAVFVQYLNCEILTIGVDSSWRIIYSSPPKEIRDPSTCIDGVIYWEERFTGRFIAFHLDGERFQLVTPPDTTNSYHLLMFGPRLAVTYPLNNEMGILYYNNGKWVRMVKYAVDHDHRNYWPEGILPDGRVVIFDNQCVSKFPHPFFLLDLSKRKLEKVVMDTPPPDSFYYSLVFRSSGFRILPASYCSIFRISGFCRYYYEENVISLRCLRVGKIKEE